MAVIESEGLTKRYGRLTAVDQLTVTVEENKIIGLVGRNGAGKSTFLKLVAGHLKPSYGKIRVFGASPFLNLTVSKNTIFIHEGLTFVPTLTVNSILELMARFYANWEGQLALRLCQYFEINLESYPRHLSKGQRNTFFTILAIASRAPLTLLDEPTSGMDKGVRKDIYRVILKDYLHHPRTMIISSHMMGELAEILEEIILLDKGKKKAHLPLEELSKKVVQIRGPKEGLAHLLDTPYVIEEKSLGPGTLSLIVKNELPQPLLDQLLSQQAEIIPVPPDEVCVYLTKDKTGGIDDVFADHPSGR